LTNSRAASRTLAELFADEFGTHVNVDEIEQVVSSALYGERDLAAALRLGLVTQREVASAIAAYVHTSLINKSGRAYPEGAHDWEPMIDAVERSLLGDS